MNFNDILNKMETINEMVLSVRAANPSDPQVNLVKIKGKDYFVSIKSPPANIDMQKLGQIHGAFLEELVNTGNLGVWFDTATKKRVT